MKKIYISLMLLGSVAITSCDMNTTPWGALDDKTAISTADDLAQFRNQIYSSLRSVTSGAWVYTSDIQLDEFNGLINNGNQVGEFSRGTFNTSNSTIEGFWGSGYSIIAACNSLIEHADRLLASEGYSDADKVKFSRYKSEALFTRAYMYFWLADHFCQSYTQTDPTKAASGMPLVTEYNPTGDVKLYPSRSTLAETFDLINSDLSSALDGIKAYEASGQTEETEKNAPTAYITSYAVEALQARVALVKGDWQTAREKAVDVIGSGNYSLTPMSEYATMWSEDEGSEIIFQPFMSSTELGGSVGGVYLSDSETSAYYLPNFGALNLYGEGDIRFEVFFKEYPQLTVEGSKYAAYAFAKYPGNTALRTGSTNNLVNMCKVFRLSEMYLIAAEAYARQGNGGEGSNYLNEFCKNRIDGYDANQTYSAENLLAYTLEERQKEFLGEGMRWSDVRREGKGFTRNSDFPEDTGLDYINDIFVTGGRNISYAASDHRLTWPIPKAELDSNPQLAGQQNSGY